MNFTDAAWCAACGLLVRLPHPCPEAVSNAELVQRRRATNAANLPKDLADKYLKKCAEIEARGKKSK